MQRPFDSSCYKSHTNLRIKAAALNEISHKQAFQAKKV